MAAVPGFAVTICNHHHFSTMKLSIFTLAPVLVVAETLLPFPKWLHDFTGLSQWPGLDPPYIPLDFIKFDVSEPQFLHQQGQCTVENHNERVCSFDCYNCVNFDDVYTCPHLSQSFDDGPSPYTPQLLHQLAQTGTKTTFFSIGYNIVRHPTIYRDCVAQGHIMGSHTWSHKFLPSLTNQQIVAQIQWSIWAINATSGHLPKWFRPPYGGVDNRVRYFLRQFGMQAVVWDFDTFDWQLAGVQTLPESHAGYTAIRSENDIYRELNGFRAHKNGQGLILEHDSLSQTVAVGIKINQILGNGQLTVPQCVGGIDYIKKFNGH